MAFYKQFVHPNMIIAGFAGDFESKQLLAQIEQGQGAVSILELLDAQNASVLAEEAAANAVYDFLPVQGWTFPVPAVRRDRLWRL